MTRDLIDLSIIIKYYSKRWKDKFHIKDNEKKSITESLSINLQEAQIVWQIGTTRRTAFRFIELKTIPMQHPFSKDNKTVMGLRCKKAYLYHSKEIQNHTVEGYVYCDRRDERKLQTIIDVDNLDLKVISVPTELKLKFSASNFEFVLPEDVHFGALIFEKTKQISVAKKYFSK